MEVLSPRLFVMIVIVISLISSLSRARGDEYWELLQFTCAPELNYFMVRTFGLYNPPTKRSWEKHGIRTLDSLKDNALFCTLGGVKLEFRLTRFHEPRPSGVCGAMEDADAILTANGEMRATLTPTHGGCPELYSHNVEVFVSRTYDKGYSYRVYHCATYNKMESAYAFGDDTDKAVTTCKLKEYAVPPARRGAGRNRP